MDKIIPFPDMRLGRFPIICTIDSMSEVVAEATEVLSVTHKAPKKKKMTDRLKESNLKKKELTERFMARHRQRAEEKKPVSADPFGDMCAKLDQELANSLPFMSQREAATYIQHSHDMDELTAVMNRRFALGLSLPATIFAARNGDIVDLVVDLQAGRRALNQINSNNTYLMRVLKERPVDPGGFTLHHIPNKESDNEQGTETPDCPD